MSDKRVVTSGPIIPSTADTPMDLRTRVQTIDDIYNIELPYVGMIVYVIDEDKYYKIKTLKNKNVGSILLKDSAVNTFEEILQGEQGSIGEDADINNLMTKKNPSGIGSFSMNRNTETPIIGEYSSALGYFCMASGDSSHAEGHITYAKGDYSHAEGHGSEAREKWSHAEGYCSKAYGTCSHAEGHMSIAKGFISHAEGCSAEALGNYSHAEGYYTIADTNSQHVQGEFNIVDTKGKYAHIVGNGADTTSGIIRSNAHTLDWDGNAWFQGDVFIKGTNQDDGQKLATEQFVSNKILEIQTPEQIDISNLMTKENPSGIGSFSMNRENDTDIGAFSSTFGCNNMASGISSFAEGWNTEASGQDSHAEGSCSKASGRSSHAEGGYTKAEGQSSHAEGNQTATYASYSHVEGYLTLIGANAPCSHAEGCNTSCSGPNSHAEGLRTCAYGDSQHVQGKDNIADLDNRYAHIVGNGQGTTSGMIKSNAHTLDWNGNAWFQGDVFVKGTSQDDGQKLATEDMVIALQQEIAELRAIIEELKNK